MFAILEAYQLAGRGVEPAECGGVVIADLRHGFQLLVACHTNKSYSLWKQYFQRLALAHKEARGGVLLFYTQKMVFAGSQPSKGRVRFVG